MTAKPRNFHLARTFRTDSSEQWVLLPCRHSWGLHVGTPFAIFDVHFHNARGVRGTLLLNRQVLKRGKRGFPSTEEQHWLALIRNRFAIDDSAPCEIRVVEATGGVLCWTGIDHESIRTFIDADWTSAATASSCRRNPEFEFNLVARTTASEVYSIWPCERTALEHLNGKSHDCDGRLAITEVRRQRIGELHLHFTETGGLASILLGNESYVAAAETLIDSVGFHLLRGSGQVFSFCIYDGTERNGMYEWSSAD
jgi:hypothetical protein